MRRDWKKYNQELIKRGEILISPQDFGLKPETEWTRKTGRPDNFVTVLDFTLVAWVV